MTALKNVIKEILSLIKFRVVLLSTLSGVTGFVLAGGGFSVDILPFIPVLFSLAAGSAALNQYQERHLDSRMERTRHRPLPSGELKAGTGLIVALVGLLLGVVFLYLRYGFLPALLGLITVVMYNGIYTYLKRVTAFAAVPGALIGAFPPAIGWTAGGGEWLSPMLAGLVFFFYLWQVPHFWLLLGLHSGDYQRAGFPSLREVFSSRQLRRITFTWILATACAGMMFPLFGMFNHAVSLVLLSILAVWLGIHALPLLKQNIEESGVFRSAFIDVNRFALLIMVILIIDHGIIKQS